MFRQKILSISKEGNGGRRENAGRSEGERRRGGRKRKEEKKGRRNIIDTIGKYRNTVPAGECRGDQFRGIHINFRCVVDPPWQSAVRFLLLLLLLLRRRRRRRGCSFLFLAGRFSGDSLPLFSTRFRRSETRNAARNEPQKSFVRAHVTRSWSVFLFAAPAAVYAVARRWTISTGASAMLSEQSVPVFLIETLIPVQVFTIIKARFLFNSGMFLIKIQSYHAFFLILLFRVLC